jgi:hypothetical protein
MGICVMSHLNYSIDLDQYTWKNVLLWGNCINHAKEGLRGSLGNKIVHWIIVAFQVLPIIGQIVSIFETCIVFCLVQKLKGNNWEYIGEVKQGQPDGKGALIFKRGIVRHVGYFKNGNYDGLGTHTDENESQYTGFHKENQRHGPGIYIYKNGNQYHGEFKNGKYDGTGIYNYKNGSQYNGEYQNGSKHGQGVWTRSDASKFAQTWESGILKKEEKIKI